MSWQGYSVVGRRAVVASLSILAVLSVLALSLTSSARAQETLKLGVLGPMSGSAAQWGVELVRGAELKAAEINAAGGLKVGDNTYKIEILPYDHKADAAEARTVTNRLVFQDKAKFIVGNAIGATTTAAQTITEPNEVLFTFISWGLKNLGPDKPFSFRTDLSGFEVVEPFYSWIKETHPNIKKMAAIAPNDESGRDSTAAIVKAAKDLGLEVVAEEYYARETKDFYPLLTRVMAANPDYIDASNSPGGSAGLIVKQLHELGYKGAKGWTGGINADTLVKVGGSEAAEGTWSPWSLNYESADTSASLKKFAADYESRYKEVPGSSAVANYITVDVLTRAMQQAGTIDTKAVVEQIIKGSFDETLRGSVVVGGTERYGINRQFLYPITISEIRGGKVVDIGKSMPIELKKAKNK